MQSVGSLGSAPKPDMRDKIRPSPAFSLLPMYEAKQSPNMLSASRHTERVSLMSQPQPTGQEDALASGDSTTISLDERHDAKKEQPGSFRIIAFHFSESRKHNRDQAKDSYPPNSFIMKAQKKHLLLALYVRFPSITLLSHNDFMLVDRFNN